MRTVNFRDDVVYPVAHLLGIDPTSTDFLTEHVRAWTASINSAVRYAWEFWDWPELNLTEERAFRDTWLVGSQYKRVNATTGLPDEIYYAVNSTYYKVLSTAVADPPIGTLPTNTAYFELLTPVDKYVSYDQTGKTPIGRVFSIYNTSPRLSPPAFGWGQRPSEFGIDVSWIAGPTVWLKYQVRPSKFTATAWSSATTYAIGDVIFDSTTGNCYVALLAGSNHTPSSSATYWQVQNFPYILSEYVKHSVAAQFAQEEQQKIDLRSDADRFLYREIDKTIEQGQTAFYDLSGSRRNRVPLGLSGFWWSVQAPDTFPVYA